MWIHSETRTWHYKNIQSGPLLPRSEVSIFEIFFEKLYEESFEDLQIKSSRKLQIRANMSHKIAVL